MNEASKTNLLRGPKFSQQYLQGRVIDIGCGRDIVSAHAEPFDLADGNAQEITAYRQRESYDTVHSSHCLEHMTDPKTALEQWWALVKEDGYMIIVVPDEDLYEQGYWPSRFNSDHKATFRLGSLTSWSPVSYDIEDLIRHLPNAEIVKAELQDAGYDHNLKSSALQATERSSLIPFRLVYKLLRIVTKPFPSLRRSVSTRVENYYRKHFNRPIDQTARDAVAQIQVIAKKGRYLTS
jgi:SAM-dependent methyltransferase